MQHMLILIVAVVMLGGCSANWNAIHFREAETRATPTLTVDAKQRFLISNVRPAEAATKQDKTTGPAHHGSHGHHTPATQVLCAEPSPDALSVLNSAITGSGTLDRLLGGTKDISAAVAFGMSRSETGGYFGLRTQTIQLIRDGMYRLCEAYANGALDGHEYKKLQQRYQTITLALLSIEQLTGAVAMRPAAFSGTAAAGTADGFVALQEKLAEAIAAAAKADAAKATAAATATSAQAALDKADADSKACGGTCTTKDAVAAALKQATEANDKANNAAAEASGAAKVAHDTASGLEAAANRSKATLLRTAAGGTSTVSTESLTDANKAVMTDDMADTISARVRQIAFGALLATHAFERCFDPDDWIKVEKKPEALKQMQQMCSASVGALTTGSLNETAGGTVAVGGDSAKASSGAKTAAAPKDGTAKPPTPVRQQLINPQALIDKLTK